MLWHDITSGICQLQVPPLYKQTNCHQYQSNLKTILSLDNQWDTSL